MPSASTSGGICEILVEFNSLRLSGLNTPGLVLFAICGTINVALVCFDLFQTIIVPRATLRRVRIAPYLIGRVLWPAYRALVRRLPESWQTPWYEAFAPLVFVVLLGVWLSLLILGFAFLMIAFGQHIQPPITQLSDALYFAGTSVLTLGFGDVVASQWPARAVVLAAAMIGLIFMALEVSLLFSMQSYLQQREQIVNTLTSRAGMPPSGLVLLLRYRELNIVPSLSTTFVQWESWVASILESHRAYPLLTYFRSSSSQNSWLAAIGATLDAAALLLTAIDGDWVGEADLYYWMAVSTLKSICANLPLAPVEGDTLTYSQFLQGLDLLKDINYHVKDNEQSFRDFLVRRSAYVRYLVPLSTCFELPLNVWLPDLKVNSLLPTK